MKTMILVLSPRESRDLLNGYLSVLVRKKFPKDYVGWVYIYCTKDTKDFLCEVDDYKELHEKGLAPFRYYLTPKRESKYHKCLNGKVVARFWCDKVEEIKSCDVPFTFEQTIRDFYTDTFNDMDNLLKASCLDYYSLEQYLKYSHSGYAIHITKLEIFDKPKEISEFYHHFSLKRCERRFSNTNIEIDDKTGGLRQPTKHGYEYVYPLTKAPRSGWCYVEM